MMNLEEEDVVFAGSPLAQHLQNIGVEFEAVSKDSDNIGEKVHGVREKMEDNVKMWEVGNSSILDLYYRKCSMEIVLSSGLLVKDDWSLLGIYMEKVNGRSLASSLKPTLKWGTFGALMLGILLSQWKSYLPTLRTALYTSIPAFVVWRWGSIWTAPVLLRKLKSFLEVTKKVDDRIKNAITIIVDCSLISRGYLLLQKDAAIWRTEKPNLLELSRRSQANLPGLRKAVVTVCERLSSAMVEATVELRITKPLPYNLDHSDLYFPEFEDDLALDSDSADSLPTVEKLRSAANKHAILRSEYLRRLFLHLLFFETVDVIWNSALEEQMRCCLEIIENALLAYKPYVCTLAKQRDVIPGRPKSYLDELATTSHSMSIHIQEALFSSQELENAVFKCKELSLLDVESVDKLNHKIKYHLQCADMCIERSVIVCGKSVSKDSSAPVPAISKSTTNKQEKQTNTASKERVDIAPCDEVFELYSKGERKRSLGEMEEEAAQPMDRGQQFLMLQELKNVLVIKAADWKERERAARRQRVGDLHDLSSLESDSEDDIRKEKSCLSKRKIERKKIVEEKMEKAMLDEDASSYQNKGGDYPALFLTPVIKEPYQCQEKVGSLAAEAVAKARAQLSLSDVQLFGSSDSEESISG